MSINGTFTTSAIYLVWTLLSKVFIVPPVPVAVKQWNGVQDSYLKISKRGKPTRKLAKYLNGKSYSISHLCVFRCLTNSLGVKPFKRPKIPRLTQKMRENSSSSLRSRKLDNWWLEMVLWLINLLSKYSPCQIVKTIVSGLGIQVILNLSFRWNFLHRSKSGVWCPIGLSQNCTSFLQTNGKWTYYRDNILAKTCSDAINWSENSRSILEKSMLADMSDYMFIHTANVTQTWCVENFLRFWRKVECRVTRQI